MSKPTVFFSHSTKDKSMIGEIKSKIDDITGGALDIFMSSDGQSIPFGQNWIHKIEQGLNDAEIMFVFVTPNSILSNWIYFEAGFAYSKGIEVIPVGIGIDIGLLKAPLNLLQGFNIISSDSLNNFITVINNKFNFHFRDTFTEKDFKKIIASTNNIYTAFDISNIFSYANFDISSDEDDNNSSYNIKEFFYQIIDHLKSNNLAFSYEDNYRYKGSKCVLTSGIKILYEEGTNLGDKISYIQSDLDKINITLSPFSFQNTFDLFSDIISLLNNKERAYLNFHLNDNYAYIISQEKVSAIISTMLNDFKFSSTTVGEYKYLKSDLLFSIFNDNSGYRGKPANYVLNLYFDIKSTTSNDIIDCLRLLIDSKIIYQKQKIRE